MAETMKNQTPSNDVMERFKNLPPEIQASYVSVELIKKTEDLIGLENMQRNFLVYQKQ